MELKNKTIVVFTNKAKSALSEIEKKYNLDESNADIIKKIGEGKPLKTNIIVNLSRTFFKRGILQEQLIKSLQKDLGVDKETAEKIFKDIDENIMPFLKEISEEDIKNGHIPEEQEIKNEPAPMSQALPKTPSTPQKKSKIATTTRKQEIIKDNSNIRKIQKSGPDNYRESIE